MLARWPSARELAGPQEVFKRVLGRLATAWPELTREEQSQVFASTPRIDIFFISNTGSGAIVLMFVGTSDAMFMPVAPTGGLVGRAADLFHWRCFDGDLPREVSASSNDS